MTGHDAYSLVDRVVEAHGGARLWKGLQVLEAEISVRGLLFAVKRREALDYVKLRIYTKEPRVTFYDYPLHGQTSEFVGDEQVFINDRDGNLLDKRYFPRPEFRRLRQELYWDDLDFIYFAGYAMWNYLTVPFLFLREGFSFEELKSVYQGTDLLSRLRVSFPKDIPTHCRTQIFYFDEQYLLRRLDYRAEVIGAWARGAHICDEYKEFDGYKAPTRRRVKPLLFGEKYLPGPTIVALDIHSIRAVRIT